jgi:flagellar biosynthesis/type III secretory pathway chaperone
MDFEKDDQEAAQILQKDRIAEPGQGAALLSEAAEMAVAENRCEIANMLLKETLAGNVQTAKLLLDLVQKRAAKRMPLKARGKTQAQTLAEERQWSDAQPEESAETPGAEAPAAAEEISTDGAGSI